MSAAIAREAACSCGQLRIRTSGEPRIVSSCNCLACQRRTGRQGDSGAGLTSHFCPKCGSTVFWENERLPDIVSVAVGAFADPTFPAPVRTVWARTKHARVGFPEGVPHHPENPATLAPR